MKKLFIFMMCLMLSFSLTGCSKYDVDGTDWNGNSGKFTDCADGDILFRFHTFRLDNDDYLYVDKETRVQYLFINNGNSYGSGCVVLVDADGKPILYEGELE